MNWQTIMILQCLFVASSVIMMRRLAADKRTAGAAYVLNAGQYVVQYGIGQVAIAVLSGVIEPKLSQYLGLFILDGVCFSLSLVFVYKMLNHVDAAIGTIISTINSIAALIGAILVLNETISWQQALGAFLLIAAVAYGVASARANTSKKHKRNTMKGLYYGLLVAFCYGIATVTEKYLLQQMNLKTYLLYGWGAQVVIAFAFALLIQPKAFVLFKQKRILKYGIGMGVTRSLGGLCFLAAVIITNNVGLMTLISNFRLIVVVFLAAIFLGERSKIMHKLAAASLAVVAIRIMF